MTLQSVRAVQVQNLEQVQDYYCSPRAIGTSAMSIYEIWEGGGAFHDSVTPSTYSFEYRSHIVRKILGLTAAGGCIYSLGCGNGFVEAQLVQLGRAVIAIDCNEEAVILTKKKGVEAFTADFFALEPGAISTCDLVYADGLIGHLFHPTDGLTRFFAKLRTFSLRPGTLVVLSNDSPQDQSVEFSPHEKVHGFWFVSKTYLSGKLQLFGLEIIESYYFAYSRPISGMRNRTICIARVPGNSGIKPREQASTS